jgi:hypothetical protein
MIDYDQGGYRQDSKRKQSAYRAARNARVRSKSRSKFASDYFDPANKPNEIKQYQAPRPTL